MKLTTLQTILPHLKPAPTLIIGNMKDTDQLLKWAGYYKMEFNDFIKLDKSVKLAVYQQQPFYVNAVNEQIEQLNCIKLGQDIQERMAIIKLNQPHVNKNLLNKGFLLS